MKTTTMIPYQKEIRGAMKVYGWISTTIHLMTSGKMEEIRKIVLLTGSMQKPVLNKSIAILSR